MCGRLGLTDPLQLQRGAGLFALDAADFERNAAGPLLVPRFNIAPSQAVIAARTRPTRHREHGAPIERNLDVLQWGLVPRWAKTPGIGGSLANARAHTLATKPGVRGEWAAAQRCLVFADVCYEWNCTRAL